MLNELAVYLYDNHHYMNSRFDDIETRIDKLDTHVDKLDTHVEKWFDYVNKRIVNIENNIKAVKNDVKAVKNDVNQRFDETRAINFNQFARVLNVKIEKIATSVQDENDQKRYQVSVDFSETVEEF